MIRRDSAPMGGPAVFTFFRRLRKRFPCVVSVFPRTQRQSGHSGRSRTGPLTLLLSIALIPSPHAWAERPGHFFHERASVEWMVGVGGWRVALGLDDRRPGFDHLTAGGELLLGLDVVPGVGVVTSGRVLAGGSHDAPYMEGLAALGAQVRVNEIVRIRTGPAAGQLRVGTTRAPLIGGFLAASVDLFRLGSGRLALALSLRLDVDAVLSDDASVPNQSLALALGIGLRY
jgi:hypothetical protein